MFVLFLTFALALVFASYPTLALALGLASSRSPGPLAEPRAVGRLAALLPGACVSCAVGWEAGYVQALKAAGFTCEQAKAAGVQTELVVVGDDCALADRGPGLAGRRGVAGTY